MAMLRSLDHRGPDETRTWIGDDAAIGATRLAIIDPADGHQPVIDESAGRIVVANGEIYGHRRIRARFADYPYRSGSDIEVIPPLIREYGESFLPHLPGTFALAVWDQDSRRLLLARDRFGERPLYWAQAGEFLLFASEPDALLASEMTRASVDRDVLAQVVRQGYVPPGRCIWQGMESLAHASVLRWQIDGVPDVSRWWVPPQVDRSLRGISDAVSWFRGALERSVQDQLVADVPVATFLSGGIDSSTVAVLAARHHPDIAAFAFDMPGDSELPFARAVAERHGIDLHVYRPDSLDVVAALHDVARVWGEPLGDSSTVPTMLLSRFVRQHAKVVLTGDGADELLGGYLCWARRFLDPADPARGLTERPSRSLLRRLRTHRGPDSAVARRYADFRSYFSAQELEALGLPAVTGVDTDVAAYTDGDANDISRFDLDHYLPGDILTKTDRASMSVGLEVRAPFLDVEVAEGCLRLPPRFKVDARHEKLLLRDAFGDLMPPEVLERPKQGFGAPMARWLSEPDLVDLIRSELFETGAPIHDLLDPAAVARVATGSDQRTWTLLAVALWWKARRPVVAAR